MTSRTSVVHLVFGLLATLPLGASATVHTVSQWGVGYPTINDAIDVAVDGDTVEVEMGVYNEDVNLDGKDVELDSVSGVEVTVIAGSSTAIKVTSGEEDAVVQSFTIWSRGNYGIKVQSSTVEFVDCWLRLNQIYTVHNYSSTDLTFTDCLFEENSGTYVAYNHYYAGAHYDGCTFTDNSTTDGGALYVDNHSEVRVTDSVFTTNQASSFGGAIFADDSLLWVEDCHFAGNVANYGTLYIMDMAEPIVLEGNTFHSNLAYEGGALFTTDSSGHVSHNVFAANEAEFGGAIYLGEDSHLLVINNTLVDNAAGTHGSGIYAEDEIATAVVDNVVAYAPEGVAIYGEAGAEASRLYLAYNDVWGNDDGQYGGALVDPTGIWGNVSVDPQFASFVDDGDPGNDDLTLDALSALVDAGAPAVSDADGSRSDMGAYGGDLEGSVAGANVVVSQRGTGDYTTIEDAFDAVADGYTIVVQPGIYFERVEYSGLDVTVRSSLGLDVTFVGGSNGGAKFSNGETDDASLEDVSVWTEGSYALKIQGADPTITGCRVLYNDEYAAHIYSSADPLLEDVEFYRNSGDYPQYVHYYSEPTFRRCSFLHNSAVDGGGLYVNSSSNPLIEDCLFHDNTASDQGGALYVYNSEITVNDSTFIGNQSYWGTVYLANVSGDDYFYRNAFCGNVAEYGGAFYLDDVSFALFSRGPDPLAPLRPLGAFA